MSLKNRLSKLETGPTDGIERFGSELANILGTIDGLFWPERDPQTPYMAGVKEAQNKYLTSGMVWRDSKSTGSARAWKSSQRKRESMAGAGLIHLDQSDGVLPLVKLTLETEQVIRKLVGLPTLGGLAVKAIHMFLESNEPDRFGCWHCETSLFKSDYKTKPLTTDWDWAASVILPMLTAGVAEASMSTVGHVFYRSIGELPNVDEPNNETDSALVDVYLDAYFGMLEHRKTYRSASGLFVPLPATKSRQCSKLLETE